MEWILVKIGNNDAIHLVQAFLKLLLVIPNAKLNKLFSINEN